LFLLFYFTDTLPTYIYPLSLHDALPILFSTWVYVVIASAMVCGILMAPLAARREWPWVREHRFELIALVAMPVAVIVGFEANDQDRKSTRLNSSHVAISYAVFCLKKKKV